MDGQSTPGTDGGSSEAATGDNTPAPVGGDGRACGPACSVSSVAGFCVDYAGVLTLHVLAVALLAASWVSLGALTGLGVPLWAAKLVSDPVLFLASFRVQQTRVFRERAPVPLDEGDPGLRFHPRRTAGNTLGHRPHVHQRNRAPGRFPAPFRPGAGSQRPIIER